MIWRFSDGTTVELGGNVEGPTLFAQWLRLELPKRKTTSIWPHPSPEIPFDANDPALLDDMLAYFAKLHRNPISARPEGIPALPPPPWGDAAGDRELVY